MSRVSVVRIFNLIEMPPISETELPTGQFLQVL